MTSQEVFVLVSMNKGDEVFPRPVQCCIAAEPVIKEVCEFPGSWPVHPKGHMTVQFADVAERGRVGRLQVIKVVELLSYFFGYIAATFFIANEPEPGVPYPYP